MGDKQSSQPKAKRRKPKGKPKPRYKYNPSATKKNKFVKGILQGKTKTEAAKDAGYSASCAAAAGSRISNIPDVKERLSKALDKAGASIDDTARVIGKAHDAKVTKVFNTENGIVYSKQLDDHPTRLKAADLALKCRGINKESDAPNMQVNIGAVVALIRKSSRERGLPE